MGGAELGGQGGELHEQVLPGGVDLVDAGRWQGLGAREGTVGGAAGPAERSRGRRDRGEVETTAAPAEVHPDEGVARAAHRREDVVGDGVDGRGCAPDGRKRGAHPGQAGRQAPEWAVGQLAGSPCLGLDVAQVRVDLRRRRLGGREPQTQLTHRCLRVAQVAVGQVAGDR